ncbi:hypothetical protein ACLB1S_06330 [Escherichia coli]
MLEEMEAAKNDDIERVSMNYAQTYRSRR